MELVHELLGYKHIKIIQNSEMFSFSGDSMLLAYFVSCTKKTNKIIDLGCGNAPIPLFLTMKMAKDQGMALTANKIAGLCGKLMCCIAYENEAYCEARKNLPSIGDIVKVENLGEGKVTSVNCLSKKVKIEIDEKIEEADADKVKIIKAFKSKENKTKEEIELEKEVE